MRLLKISAVVIGALIVVFLIGIGVFFPSFEYSQAIQVNASQQKCWNAFHDVAKTSQWMDGFESLTLKSGHQLEPGARYELVISDRGERMVMEETVTDVAAPEHITFFLINDVLVSDYTFTFTPLNNEVTSIESHYRITGKNIFWKSILLLSKTYMSDTNQQQLNKLKSVIEQP